MARIAAPFRYWGSKVRMAPWIIERLPAHNHYIEACAGSAAIMAIKEPVDAETLNDIYGEVCVAPATRLLGGDLRWVEAGSVRVGDRLTAFDEENGPSSYRRYQTTTVTGVSRRTTPCYRLKFDDGTTVVCSSDHQWLTKGRRWIATDQMRVGMTGVLKLCDVVGQEMTFDAGWLSGFFDGEGSIRGTGSGWGVCVTQKLGPELERCESLLAERGFEFEFTTAVRKGRSEHWQPVADIELRGGVREILRFLMMVRPERLVKTAISRLPERSIYGRDRQLVTLVGKEFIGESEVVSIETDTHTFIAEGLASHNCNFFRVLRDPETAAELIDLVAFTPYAQSEFREALLAIDVADAPPVGRAWGFFVRMQMAVVPGRTGWSYGVGGASTKKANKPGRWATMPEHLLRTAQRFERVQITEWDVVDLIGRMDTPGALILIDPPYLEESRPKSMGASSAYVQDQFDHDALVAAMLESKHASFAITHYPHEFYDAIPGIVSAGDYSSHRNIPNGDAGRDVQAERLYILDRSGAN